MELICGPREQRYLTAQDPVLGAAIRNLGPLRRAGEPDLCRCLTRQIVGQQISSAALKTIWSRLLEALGEITPQSLLDAAPEALRRCGLSGRKVQYLQQLALRMSQGALTSAVLQRMTDAEVIACLCESPGIGCWTAEMTLMFHLLRPDVVSFGDFGIRRGICLVYGLPELTRAQFELLRARWRPYGTAASLCLWAISGGALSGTGVKGVTDL